MRRPMEPPDLAESPESLDSIFVVSLLSPRDGFMEAVLPKRVTCDKTASNMEVLATATLFRFTNVLDSPTCSIRFTNFW